MSTPLEVVELDFGEDAVYSPPPGADRWSAFRHSSIMPTMGEGGYGNANITYGGSPPQWTLIGGWDIAADEYIPLPEFTAPLDAPATGFEQVASASGFAASWHSLASAAADGLRSILMAVAYSRGRAIHKTIFRVPPPAAIDATVVAAQERRLLQSLLLARDARAGAGGVIRVDHGSETGSEEFESLAVLDRRIAECRARIAWFEQAGEGNDLPRATYW